MNRHNASNGSASPRYWWRGVDLNKRGVYLLHFSEPYEHAKHYLGYGDDIERRIEEHRQGRGSRLTQVARKAGITFTVARVWRGKGRHFERHLKNRKSSPRLCPICNGELDKALDFTLEDIEELEF